MPNIVLGQVEELNDPKLQQIAKRVFHTFRLANEKSIAHHNDPAKFPMPADTDSLEHMFLKRLRQLRPERQQMAALRVMPMVNASEDSRKKMYKDLSAVNLRAADPIGKQFSKLALPANLKIKLDDLLKTPYAGGIVPSESTVQLPAGPTSQTAMKKLELRIRRVKCVDETSSYWEWAGDDEIYLGGTTVDAVGETKKVNAFKVGDFNDGTEKKYNPLKSFCLFDLAKGAKWPKSHFVTLVLIEKDSGGAADFLDTLLKKVKEKVTDYLKDLTDGYGEIGEAIGAIVAKVLEWIWDFISFWDDDIFPPKTVTISIPSQKVRFNGKTETGERIAKFKGHDGQYAVYYDWHLIA
ncbi:MAG: hypothetical protein JNN28_14980 [Saprospiraceae bacterium]|nr:hypothetical protein [Saprospiraceae bacterium]